MIIPCALLRWLLYRSRNRKVNEGFNGYSVWVGFSCVFRLYVGLVGLVINPRVEPLLELSALSLFSGQVFPLSLHSQSGRVYIKEHEKLKTKLTIAL